MLIFNYDVAGVFTRGFYLQCLLREVQNTNLIASLTSPVWL